MLKNTCLLLFLCISRFLRCSFWTSINYYLIFQNSNPQSYKNFVSEQVLTFTKSKYLTFIKKNHFIQNFIKSSSFQVHTKMCEKCFTYSSKHHIFFENFWKLFIFINFDIFSGQWNHNLKISVASVFVETFVEK